MFRFHQPYYNEYKAFASENLGTKHPVPNRKGLFDFWIAKFESWNDQLPFSNLGNLRVIHNEIYGQILKSTRDEEVANGLRYTQSVARFVSQVRITLTKNNDSFSQKLITLI